MAMQAIDPTNKGVISRMFRRALEQYDKQVFTGPPENPKEAVVCAAKGLQRGDWQSAFACLEPLKIWGHIDPSVPENGVKMREMVKEKVKIEALRTYLFSYASIYDAFHLEQLVGMFSLPDITIRSIISKMMIKEEITAFWDEDSMFVLVQHVEPTPLQRLALSLADRAASAVDMNERLVDQKEGANAKGLGKGAGRWDAMGGNAGKGKARSDNKGKGKGKGKSTGSGQPRNRGWDNARPMVEGGRGPPPRRSQPSRTSDDAWRSPEQWRRGP